MYMLQGPDLVSSMLGILCRLQKNKVPVACDIEKMFYNLSVTPSDRDYIYNLFGKTSSSSLAVATYGLRTLADDYAWEYPEAANLIQKEFYVSDGITSLDTAEEARQLIEDARAQSYSKKKKTVLGCSMLEPS